MRRIALFFAPLLALPLVLAGCQSGPSIAGVNLFERSKPTAFQTPANRIVAIRDTAKQATGEDTPEQQQIVADLVRPLPHETDPLIRQARLETIAEFNTPLASQALLAGLEDNNPFVRISCCRKLADRKDPGAAAGLARLAQGDSDFDVRLAAAAALGRVGADKALLLPVLQDPDPAMQLVGVEAMRNLTGRDLGTDVATYIAVARGEQQAAEAEISVADRRSGWLPF